MLPLVICSIFCWFQIFVWIVVNLQMWSGIQFPFGLDSPDAGMSRCDRLMVALSLVGMVTGLSEALSMVMMFLYRASTDS